MKEPVVSICIITYNHEQYLRQALDSFLSQQTDFHYEIVIGEDSSPDATRLICEEYAQRFPGKINLLPSDRRYGMMGNFIRTLEACKGEFVAMCEGDDYWIDNTKLQKQVDFLKANKEFSICFHHARLQYQEGLLHTYPDINKNTPAVTGLHDIMLGNYIHTPTCMFRKNIDKFPEWFINVFPGDWPLHIMNAYYGKIYFMPEEMSVYRIHSGGTLSTKKSITNEVKTMETYSYLASWFKGKDEVVYKYFRSQYYHQRGFYKGIMNVDELSRFKRSGILLDASLKTRRPKLLVASFLSLILPADSLKKIWAKASKIKS